MTEFTRRALKKISPVYENSDFIKAYFDALSFKYEPIRRLFTQLREQLFTQTVTYNIETLEHKYSLEPRPDLSLEERRARLGIKVARKLPLNPAVLEKFALDNYGLKIYLDESRAGYIEPYLNHANDKLLDYLQWLYNEKPAHLMLGSHLILIDFIGGGGEFDTDHVITDINEILPKTDADRANLPRVFFSLVETAIGMRTISLPKPKNLKQSVRAGIILTENGLRGGYDWAFPNILIGNRNRAYVGQFLLRGGEVTINADLRDLPTYEDLIENPIADLLIADVGIVRGGEFEFDVETLEKFYRSNIFSGAVLHLTGEREAGLTKPKNAAQKFFIGDALGRFGTIKIAPSTERRLTKKIVIRAGQTLYRAGNIFVESQTRPTIPEGKRFFGRVENVTNYVATALGKLGYEQIKPGSQRWQALHKTVMRVGAAMIRSGEITVDCADDFFDVEPDGDWLKLIFASATSTRALTLPNPRDDLAKSDIRQFGDATVADEILLTRDGQIVTALIRAALIKKSVKVLF